MLETLKEKGEGGDEPNFPAVLPWWEASEVKDELDDDTDGDELEYADIPEAVPVEILVGITPPGGVGKKLVYNAMAIWYDFVSTLKTARLTYSVAYLHTLLSFRLPALEEIYLRDSGVEITDVKSEIGRLVPFLVDPKSTIRYTTIREAYSSIWERIGTDEVR